MATFTGSGRSGGFSSARPPDPGLRTSLYVLEVQILQQRGVGFIPAGFDRRSSRCATLRRLAASAAIDEPMQPMEADQQKLPLIAAKGQQLRFQQVRRDVVV